MRSQLVLVGVIAALVGCGGAEGSTVSEESTTPVTAGAARRPGIRDMDSYVHTVTIPLRTGELRLGTNSASDPFVQFALRAETGELAMAGCDFLEAQADENDLELGVAEYRRVSGTSSEELVTVASRSDLVTLASAERATLVTCHEILELDEDVRAHLGAFLRGEAAPTEDLENSRTITLEGGHLNVSYRSSAPDTVRFHIHFDEGNPASCPRMSLRAGSRTVELDHPEGDADAGVFTARRAAIQPIVAQSSARLTACGRTFELQPVELEVLKTFLEGS